VLDQRSRIDKYFGVAVWEGVGSQQGYNITGSTDRYFILSGGLTVQQADDRGQPRRHFVGRIVKACAVFPSHLHVKKPSVLVEKIRSEEAGKLSNS